MARRCIGRRRPPATSTKRSCARTISDRLGLEWGEVRNGAAELAGVPAEILVEFSKRRQEMLRAAELGGISLDTKAGGEAAALATRDRKEYGIDTHTWREEVQARAAELGFGREEITELLEHGRERLAHGLARARRRRRAWRWATGWLVRTG